MVRNNFKEAEKSVAEYLREHGFEKVEITPLNFPLIDITAEKNGKRFAFQVKDHANPNT